MRPVARAQMLMHVAHVQSADYMCIRTKNAAHGGMPVTHGVACCMLDCYISSRDGRCAERQRSRAAAGAQDADAERPRSILGKTSPLYRPTIPTS
eukprot:2837020-Pleurochrysis_carterae.AAC.2